MLHAILWVLLGMVIGGMFGAFAAALAAASRNGQTRALYDEAQLECKALHESNTRLIGRLAEAAMEISALKTEVDGWRVEASK